MTAPQHSVPAHSGLGFECSFGHELHQGNTGWVGGEPYCLDCVVLAHQADEVVAGRLILTMLNLAPLPSREEVAA